MKPFLTMLKQVEDWVQQKTPVLEGRAPPQNGSRWHEDRGIPPWIENAMLAKARTKLECAFDFNAIRKLLNLTPAAPWRTRPTSRLRGVWNPKANEEPHLFNMYRRSEERR